MSPVRDLFISYTWADVDMATALNDALRAAGFTTWFHPAGKPKGAGIADWMEQALDAVGECTQLISHSIIKKGNISDHARRINKAKYSLKLPSNRRSTGIEFIKR